MRKTAYFNMVEIVLALTVIAIGVMSVISLIPIGTKATMDAIGRNYAADTGDEFLSLLAGQMVTNWGTLDQLQGDTQLVDVSLAQTSDSALTGWTPVLGQTDTDYYWMNPAPFYVWRVVKRNAAGTATDFDALIRVWKSSTTAWEFDGTNWGPSLDTDCERRAQLNMELSWPATLRYEARTKDYYAREVFRHD